MSVDIPTKYDQRNAASNGGDLVGRLADEMLQRWHAGERPLVEEFLERHPQLLQEPEAAVRLIYEEVCLREEHGLAVPPEAVMHRFPQWRTQLEAILAAPIEPVLSTVEECPGEFVLLAELGHGGQGRVYLAGQTTLADRPVVLKVTPCEGHEHLKLARLQHTHIVPLYAVQHDSKRNLRTLCMPYLGGAALNQILGELKPTPVSKRCGQDLLDALDRAETRLLQWKPGASLSILPSVALPLSAAPVRQLFARLSYVQAICWIGVCLADALHYAHERNLVHLDLKPGNVLLTADGQPMLLDFHIAQKPIRPRTAMTEDMGGTPPYMSPEQQAAVAAINQGKRIPTAVDHRSDIYSMGLLLHEALAGTLPAADSGPIPPLHRGNPHISLGLSDIIAKCLARDPVDRYSTAAALATDLRAHLDDLPLRGARNRSLLERWRKWRRRQPHVLAWTFMRLAVLIAALSLGIFAYDRADQPRRDAEAALAEGQRQLKTQSYAQAVDTLSRGLALAKHAHDGGELEQQLDVHLQAARRAVAAQQLHLLVDRLRFLHGASAFSVGETESLAHRFRVVWDKHVWLRERSGVEGIPEQQLDADLLDLGIIWADLRVRLAETDKANEARREALQILADTEAVFGESHVLCRLRETYAIALGQTALAGIAGRRATELPPQSAWEHYSLGRALLQSGELEQAAAMFARAIELQPQGFWPHFHQGVCAHRQKRYEDAVTSFRIAIALAPRCAECYYNRALALSALHRNEQALRDYDMAIQLDPNLSKAVLNRGILQRKQKK